jgi:hypothetical protein
VLKIKITHEGFLEILSQSVETSFNPDVYQSVHQWRLALARSDVRLQWDPDRSLRGERLERRAIQIGIRGETVQKYVRSWIIQLEEVTALAKQIGEAVRDGREDAPQVPDEIEYSVSQELQQRLGMRS